MAPHRRRWPLTRQIWQRRGIGGTPAPQREGCAILLGKDYPRLRMANALSAMEPTANPLMRTRSFPRFVPGRSVSVARTPSAAYVGGANLLVNWSAGGS